MPPSFLRKQSPVTLGKALGLAPGLSENEQRMAAMAGLGFTSSESAKLAGIEENADVTDAANVAAAGAQMASNLVTGSVTLDNAATTSVALASVTANSEVFLTPSNAAAAVLVAGASSPYVTLDAGVGFDIDTADAGSAAGTETFFYMVRI